MTKIILLHGALGTKNQFSSLKENLEKTFEVYCFDFEGHGEYKSTNPYTIDRFVQNLNKFMNEYHIDEAALFGYSMGGYVALKFAALFPEKALKIFTYGTKFDWNPTTSAEEIKKLDAEKISAKIPHFAAHLEKMHQEKQLENSASKNGGVDGKSWK